MFDFEIDGNPHLFSMVFRFFCQNIFSQFTRPATLKKNSLGNLSILNFSLLKRLDTSKTPLGLDKLTRQECEFSKTQITRLIFFYLLFFEVFAKPWAATTIFWTKQNKIRNGFLLSFPDRCGSSLASLSRVGLEGTSPMLPLPEPEPATFCFQSKQMYKLHKISLPRTIKWRRY